MITTTNQPSAGMDAPGGLGTHREKPWGFRLRLWLPGRFSPHPLSWVLCAFPPSLTPRCLVIGTGKQRGDAFKRASRMDLVAGPQGSTDSSHLAAHLSELHGAWGEGPAPAAGTVTELNHGRGGGEFIQASFTS